MILYNNTFNMQDDNKYNMVLDYMESVQDDIFELGRVECC